MRANYASYRIQRSRSGARGKQNRALLDKTVKRSCQQSFIDWPSIQFAPQLPRRANYVVNVFAISKAFTLITFAFVFAIEQPKFAGETPCNLTRKFAQSTACAIAVLGWTA
ncbi:hypothetical protein AUC45_13150 [Erythrobacter sp. YT30]|nr:hypothetical protein AUC45_13150 [Erythrobacter sp. YT30]